MAENSHQNAANSFLELVNELSEKGWHGFGPSSGGEDSFLYISFHVNPEKADSLNKLIEASLVDFDTDFWFVNRSRNNRFYLCSKELKEKADELNSFEDAISEIGRLNPELGRDTAQNLKLLTKIIRNKFEKEGGD
ncbi:MAG: hypothetical protein OQK51_12880 [Kangiellaceae bacterium]|nr:hypothetical protein [Kangiellaceae bacterium]